MTRIDCIPVEELCDQHLRSNYREMLRMDWYVNRWLNSRKPSTIPSTYRMNQGHVAFFYDKLAWIIDRHWALVEEMWFRGFEPNFVLELDDLPTELFNQWQPTEAAQQINTCRILDRLGNFKPTWTKRDVPKYYCE